jgi:ABC-2 type transport system ATP-binding protein
VLVRTPHLARLEALVRGSGGTSVRASDGALEVSGLTAPEIGDLAAEHGIAVHELSPQEASLEAAYLELTGDSVDFRVRVGAS